MSDSIRLYEISGCISRSKQAAESRLYSGRCGIDEADRLRSDISIAQQAEAELEKILKHLPELQRLAAAQARTYDMGPPFCCSCHISPPCNFCVEQREEDEP